MMAVCNWRGNWYIYNHVKKEFLRDAGRFGIRKPAAPDSMYMRWTPGIIHAKRYRNPSQAQKMAARINTELEGRGSASWPCQPVSVVTGEAARCLDLINRRKE